MGEILRGGTGEKSQVSSKCSRVRFSEMAFLVPTRPFSTGQHKNVIYIYTQPNNATCAMAR